MAMRKTVLFVLLLCGWTLVAHAQITDKFWMGAGFGFSVKDDEGQKAVTYKLLPEDYIQTVVDSYPLLCEQITTGIHLSVFARFSFLQGRLGKLFLDGGVQYMWGKIKIDGHSSEVRVEDQWARYNSYNHDSNTKYAAIGIRPGIWINITRHIALMGKFGFLGYQYQKVEGSGSGFSYRFLNGSESYRPYYYGGDNKTITSYGLDLDMSQFQIGVNFTF